MNPPVDRIARFEFLAHRLGTVGGIAFAVAFSVLAATPASADIVFHTGTSASQSSGIDVVNVDLFSYSPPGAVAVGTVFHEMATHSFGYLYEAPLEPPLMFVEFAIINDTTKSWGSYSVDLYGADFVGINYGEMGGDLARATDAVSIYGIGPDEVLFVPGLDADVTVKSSLISRDVNSSSMTVKFGESLHPGEYFSMMFFIDDIGPTDVGFAMSQTPFANPAPAAALLGIIGFVSIGWVRRRFV